MGRRQRSATLALLWQRHVPPPLPPPGGLVSSACRLGAGLARSCDHRNDEPAGPTEGFCTKTHSQRILRCHSRCLARLPYRPCRLTAWAGHLLGPEFRAWQVSRPNTKPVGCTWTGYAWAGTLQAQSAFPPTAPSEMRRPWEKLNLAQARGGPDRALVVSVCSQHQAALNAADRPLAGALSQAAPMRLHAAGGLALALFACLAGAGTAVLRVGGAGGGGGASCRRAQPAAAQPPAQLRGRLRSCPFA